MYPMVTCDKDGAWITVNGRVAWRSWHWLVAQGREIRPTIADRNER